MYEFLMPNQGGPNPDQAGAAPAAPVPQAVLQEEGAQGPSASGQGFFDKLRTDPKLSQAMLMTGLRMMQGARPGQNTMGLIGDAMLAGATAHNMLTYNEQEGARKDQELAMKQAESGARVAASQANTAATQQETSQKAETFPDMKVKLQTEIKNLKANGRSAEAKALADEYRAGNIKTEVDLENSLKRAQIGAQGASAAANSALARTRTQEGDAQAMLLDPNATEQQVEVGTRVLNKGKTDAKANKDQVKMFSDLVKAENPDWTPQQVAGEVRNIMTSGKVNYMQAAQKVLENASEYDPATVEAARAVVGGGLQKKAGTTVSGKAAAPAGVKVITEADVTNMMHNYGKSRQEVLRDAKRLGYTLEGN